MIISGKKIKNRRMIIGLTRSGCNLKKNVLEINEAGASDDQLIKLVWPYMMK